MKLEKICRYLYDGPNESGGGGLFISVAFGISGMEVETLCRYVYDGSKVDPGGLPYVC